MDELGRMLLILELISEAERLLGSISRTHLQKLVYLLQEIKSAPLNYSFKMGYYGPRSDELWGTLCGMRDLGLIDILSPAPFGYKYLISGSKGDKLKKFRKIISMSDISGNTVEYQKSCKELVQLISQHQQGGTWYLELLGITHFVHKMIALYHPLLDEEIINAVRGLKPHFKGEDVEQALATLREENFLNDA